MDAVIVSGAEEDEKEGQEEGEETGPPSRSSPGLHGDRGRSADDGAADDGAADPADDGVDDGAADGDHLGCSASIHRRGESEGAHLEEGRSPTELNGATSGAGTCTGIASQEDVACGSGSSRSSGGQRCPASSLSALLGHILTSRDGPVVDTQTSIPEERWVQLFELMERQHQEKMEAQQHQYKQHLQMLHTQIVNSIHERSPDITPSHSSVQELNLTTSESEDERSKGSTRSEKSLSLRDLAEAPAGSTTDNRELHTHLHGQALTAEGSAHGAACSNAREHLGAESIQGEGSDDTEFNRSSDGSATVYSGSFGEARHLENVQESPRSLAASQGICAEGENLFSVGNKNDKPFGGLGRKEQTAESAAKSSADGAKQNADESQKGLQIEHLQSFSGHMGSQEDRGAMAPDVCVTGKLYQASGHLTGTVALGQTYRVLKPPGSNAMVESADDSRNASPTAERPLTSWVERQKQRQVWQKDAPAGAESADGPTGHAGPRPVGPIMASRHDKATQSIALDQLRHSEPGSDVAHFTPRGTRPVGPIASPQHHAKPTASLIPSLSRAGPVGSAAAQRHGDRAPAPHGGLMEHAARSVADEAFQQQHVHLAGPGTFPHGAAQPRGAVESPQHGAQSKWALASAEQHDGGAHAGHTVPPHVGQPVLSIIPPPLQQRSAFLRPATLPEHMTTAAQPAWLASMALSPVYRTPDTSKADSPDSLSQSEPESRASQASDCSLWHKSHSFGAETMRNGSPLHGRLSQIQPPGVSLRELYRERRSNSLDSRHPEPFGQFGPEAGLGFWLDESPLSPVHHVQNNAVSSDAVAASQKQTATSASHGKAAQASTNYQGQADVRKRSQAPASPKVACAARKTHSCARNGPAKAAPSCSGSPRRGENLPHSLPSGGSPIKSGRRAAASQKRDKRADGNTGDDTSSYACSESDWSMETSPSPQDPVQLSRLRVQLREKHARHLADLRSYYEGEIASLTEKLSKSSPRSPRREAQRASQRCDELERALKVTHQRIRDLELRNRELEAQLTEWRERYETAAVAARAMQQRLEEARAHVRQREGATLKLQARLRDVEHAFETAYKLSDDKEARIQREHKMLQDLLAEYESLAKENERVKEALRNTEDKLFDANNEISELKRMKSRLEAQIKQIEHEHVTTKARSSDGISSLLHINYSSSSPAVVESGVSPPAGDSPSSRRRWLTSRRDFSLFTGEPGPGPPLGSDHPGFSLSERMHSPPEKDDTRLQTSPDSPAGAAAAVAVQASIPPFLRPFPGNRDKGNGTDDGEDAGSREGPPQHPHPTQHSHIQGIGDGIGLVGVAGSPAKRDPPRGGGKEGRGRPLGSPPNRRSSSVPPSGRQHHPTPTKQALSNFPSPKRGSPMRDLSLGFSRLLGKEEGTPTRFDIQLNSVDQPCPPTPTASPRKRLQFIPLQNISAATSPVWSDGEGVRLSPRVESALSAVRAGTVTARAAWESDGAAALLAQGGGTSSHKPPTSSSSRTISHSTGMAGGILPSRQSKAVQTKAGTPGSAPSPSKPSGDQAQGQGHQGRDLPTGPSKQGAAAMSGGPARPYPTAGVKPVVLSAPYETEFSVQERMRTLGRLEKQLDELTLEKQQIESALSRIPSSGGRVTRQIRMDKDELEERLEKVNRELGSVRMTLKRFHVLRSSNST
ncbi:M-phase phosphoprotein 9 isoform X1 [Petromyzon marinus]|uniref:M-phase phosphoprotein 9 isoform X1 n=1 Tax=Petromyzon marinus TaxID=7757 RepID=UPI003F7307C9